MRRLAEIAKTRSYSRGSPVGVRFAPDGEILFLRSGPEDPRAAVYAFAPETGQERLVVDAPALLGGGEEQLSPEALARLERARSTLRGIGSFVLTHEGANLLVATSGRLFLVARATGSVVCELPGDGGDALDVVVAPNGRVAAVARGGAVYLVDLDTHVQRCLVAKPGPGRTAGVAEFVAQEEMKRMRGMWWSPDSRRLAVQHTDERMVDTLYIADAMNPGRAPLAFAYPMAGTDNAVVRLTVVDVGTGLQTPVPWDAQRWPYLARVVWSGSAPLTLVVQDRNQHETAVLTFQGEGPARELHVERDEAWCNLDTSMPRWIEGGTAVLWSSEREGSWQLEVRGADGGLRRVVMGPGAGYRRVIRVEGSQAWVIASVEPTEAHVWRVSLDGSGARPVTSSRGVHHAVVGRTHVLIVSMTPDGGMSHVVLDKKTGDAVGQLTSMARPVPAPPRRVDLRLGPDEARAVLLHPTDWDGTSRLPVLLKVYAGPRSQVAMATGRRYLLDQWLADQGFAVLAIDGRGTPWRTRAWERALYRDLARVPVEDQVRYLKLALEERPELDGDRVGVYGWSFGGFMTAHLLGRHPEVFRCGVAGAPVGDFAQYDTHYTERYMDRPADNPEGYAAASAVEAVRALRRPMMIVHGTADDNVYFCHALQLSDALLRGGVPHDFLPLAGHTHMVQEPEVVGALWSAIAAYFRRHL